MGETKIQEFLIYISVTFVIVFIFILVVFMGTWIYKDTHIKYDKNSTNFTKDTPTDDNFNFGFLGDINGFYGFAFKSSIPLDYESGLNICEDLGYTPTNYTNTTCPFPEQHNKCFRCIGVNKNAIR